MQSKIREDVKALLESDNSGHGMEHVERVYTLAMHLAEEEKANTQIVALAALLHDVDDYKLFGQTSADNLINANQIMDKYGVAPEVKAQVCEIIHNMGYSKSLKGIRPQSLEGKIVSDADMLDAIGALGTIRCLAFAMARCEKKIFDATVFPDLNLSAEEYKKPNRVSDNFVNHFFEKLLRIKAMMFTPAAKKEAEIRHRFMVEFLQAFFREQGCRDWLDYLENYEQENKKAA